MGLDITAYKGLTKVDGKARKDFDYAHGEVVFYHNKDFKGRFEGLDEEAVYNFTDSMGFRAGSYSGYSTWREQLAELAGYPATPYTGFGEEQIRHDSGAWKATEGPFWELINFADNEGTIGPVVSAKLAQDFAKFRDAAMNHPDEWFREKYKDWQEAFEMASDNGAVDFH